MATETTETTTETTETTETTTSTTSTTETTSTSTSTDGCSTGDGTPVDASAACNQIAKIEGNGKYTQQNAARFSAAAGRYQFMGSTAVGVIVGMGAASSKSAATTKWTQCRTSNSQECKSLQDKMCNYYSTQILSQLKAKGIPTTTRNLYLAWNQGVGGASAILKAAAAGTTVTNPNIAGNMKNQAWVKTADAAKFLAGLEGWMRQRGVTP